MATLELTKENFASTLDDNDMVLIDFWAEWCGPCRRFGPIFEEISEKHPDVIFAKLDTEAEQEIAASLEIQAIPTLMALRDGVLLYREAGALDARQLEGLVQDMKAIDMVAVKAEIAKQQAEGGHDHDHSDHEGHNH